MESAGAPAALVPLPVRARERKPQKRPAQPVDDPAEQEQSRSKRQRRVPEWMAQDFSVEDVPARLSEGLKRTLADAELAKPVKAKPDVTRMLNWRLVDRKTMVVELEHGGKRYHGILKKTGVSPIAGVVTHTQEEYPNNAGAKDICALCNLSLTQQVHPVEEELQRVVRVAISANWVAQVHLICGLWAPEVYEDTQGNLINLSGAIRRARALKCAKCKERGAGLCCAHRGCQRVYHLPCADELGCALDEPKFQLLCPVHSGPAIKD